MRFKLKCLSSIQSIGTSRTIQSWRPLKYQFYLGRDAEFSPSHQLHLNLTSSVRESLPLPTHPELLLPALGSPENFLKPKPSHLGKNKLIRLVSIFLSLFLLTWAQMRVLTYFELGFSVFNKILLDTGVEYF
jgi:hypothetical protein